MNGSSLNGRLYVITAPSGAGKTTLVKALVNAEARVRVAVSHTTRQKRAEEQEGLNYHFVDKATFEQMIASDQFLEWARVFGNLYGTSLQEVDKLLAGGNNMLLEIDWQGAQQVRQSFPDAVSIFILPPSVDALRQRLIARGQDDDASVQHRTDLALEELSHHDEFDYLIVNDDFDTALSQLQQILAGQGAAYSREQQTKTLAALIANLIPHPQEPR